LNIYCDPFHPLNPLTCFCAADRGRRTLFQGVLEQARPLHLSVLSAESADGLIQSVDLAFCGGLRTADDGRCFRVSSSKLGHCIYPFYPLNPLTD